MAGRKHLSGLLTADIFAMAVLYLIPDNWGDWQVKKILIILMAIGAVVLTALISRKKEKETHVRVAEIDSVSQMNPGQYLSKGGPVCAGSDGRYHVTFSLKDDTDRYPSDSFPFGKAGRTIGSGYVRHTDS